MAWNLSSRLIELLLLAVMVLTMIMHTKTIKIEISKPSPNSTTTELSTTIRNYDTTTAVSRNTTAPIDTTVKPSSEPPLTTKTMEKKTTESTRTSATTTKPPSSSEANPTTGTTVASATESRINSQSGNYFCGCDLLDYHCDINCCCDTDCSKDILKSFNCHQHQQQHHQNRDLDDFQYSHGLLPSCKIRDGWLCVFRINYSPAVVENNFNANFDTTLRFSRWPNTLLDVQSHSSGVDFYKIDDPILLYNIESLELNQFELPFSLVSPYCQIFEPIRHLNSVQRECLITTLDQAQNNERKLLSLLTESKLLPWPKADTNIDCTMDKNQCIPITVRQCNSSGFSCHQSTNTSQLDVNEEYFCSSSHSCYISEIHINIRHNFTHLQACEVNLLRKEIDSDTEDLWQSMVIDFIHEKEAHAGAIASNVSGPLGYIQGYPLITACLVPFNESAERTATNLVLDYFHPNGTRARELHSIKLPQRKQGFCIDNPSQENSFIAFGIKSLSKCAVQWHNTTELTAAANFTAICDHLQKKAYHFMLGNLTQHLGYQNYFVSELGHPVNDTKKWIKIEYKNYEQIPIIGSFIERDNSFVCQNMVIGVRYEFLAGTLRVADVPHQNVIKRSIIDFGRRHDLQFRLDEAIMVPISISVMFYDFNEASDSDRGAATAIRCNLLLIAIRLVHFVTINFTKLIYS